MASVVSMVGINVFCGTKHSLGQFSSPSQRINSKRVVVVRAETTINPEIRKNEEKVVDSVIVTELSKNITPYCRCWRSGTFPLCDGSHMKHNKETGDNVGPLLLKKQ
uniref:Iron-binding zinc finger CDGSH type domain-containing protein n=1 Tax=Opuntia streptacantha TaxID=393608 RepID=A0A7C9FAA8_OPUST